jgi:DNA-binding response OmpR family regulator
MRLLIVEDEEVLGENLKKILEMRGFAVDLLADALKARTRLHLYKDEYSLLLLDLGLPGMDGQTLTRNLRERGLTIPIIILTGKSDTKNKIELLNSGADDYVVKPFSSDELVARINSVLRRPAKVIPPSRKIGSIEIDSATHRLRYGTTEIPLTTKEYSLFECLSNRPNEVVTRDELCTQVWDFNSLSWSNVLDVHMKNLRKKLHQSDYGTHLETIRGIGYRLVV